MRETLESKGVLGDLRARIRASVFATMDEKDDPKPRLCHENLLLNEAIREYLEFAGYKHTLGVFMAGKTAEPLPSLRAVTAAA